MEKENNKNIEKEYIIPLREKCRVVPRYKKANKAIRTIKEFLVRHMKIRDRDLNKIKIDGYLNEVIWFRGIRKPPIKIKVKAIKEGEIIRVYLVDMPEKLKFKKLREEKREQKATEIKEKKKSVMEKAKSLKAGEASKKPSEETIQKPEKEKIEEKKIESEKKSAVVEAGKEFERATAQKIKHQTGGKTKQPKHQFRKALAK